MTTAESAWPFASARRTALAVFAYGFAMALLFAFVIYQSGVVAANIDVNCFGQIARNLLAGEGFSMGYGPTVRRAPLYPFLGAAVLWLAGRDPKSFPDAEFYAPLLVANCLMFAATCVVVWEVTRRAFGGRAAVLAVAICPLIPQSLRYIGRTEVESLTQLCVALLALTGVKLVTRPGIKAGVAFGLVAAVSTLGKPITQLYPLLLAPLAFWYWHRERTPMRTRVVTLAVTFACFLLPLVPWMARNAAVTDGAFKGISSNAPAEFLRGYVNAQPKYFLLRQDFGGHNPALQTWDPEANDYEERQLAPHGMPFYRARFDANGRLEFVPPIPEGVSSASIEVRKDAIQSAEMKRRALADPLEFAGKFAAQLGTFWYIAETRAKSAFIGSIALAMLALAVLGLLDARRRGAFALVWPVALVIVYHNAIYAAFLALGRYSMPLYPTLTILSAGGLVVLARRFRPKGATAVEPEASAGTMP